MSKPNTLPTMTKEQIEAVAATHGMTVPQMLKLARRIFAVNGGKKGTGASKRRSPEHYQRMVDARNRQREEAKKAEGEGVTA